MIDLVSVINGEKAAVNNPLFAQKRERTLEMLLRNLYQEYMGDANKVGTVPLCLADVCRFYKLPRNQWVDVNQSRTVSIIYNLSDFR